MVCFCLPRTICVATFELIVVAAGCSGHDAQKPDPYGVDVIAIASRKELFPGDLKRLEPHLDLIASGCVALNVRDRDWTQSLSLEVWTKGKATKPKVLGGETSLDIDEISISIKEASDQESRLKVTIVERGPKGSAVFQILLEKPLLEKPALKELGSFAKTLLRETPIKKNEATTIWGYMSGEMGGRIDGDETFEEMAKREQWAILLKVTPQEKK